MGKEHTWNKKVDEIDIEPMKVITLHLPLHWLDLIEKFINHYSEGNMIVLDIFGGSGSTLIACERTDRICRIADIEGKNCQIIIQRWCDFTEINDIKINGVPTKWSEYKNNS